METFTHSHYFIVVKNLQLSHMEVFDKKSDNGLIALGSTFHTVGCR
jgi:hypothetical protein